MQWPPGLAGMEHVYIHVYMHTRLVERQKIFQTGMGVTMAHYSITACSESSLIVLFRVVLVG